jgi:hypothetical protein
MSALMTSARTGTGRDDWRTPQCVIDRVLEVGPIVLDPCSAPDSLVPAAERIMLPDDGLEAPWPAVGLVYVNPPFSRLRPWLERVARWGRIGGETIALVPARTDTRAWQDHATGAAAVCFWRGRIRFVGASAGAPFPTAFLYFGPRVGRFVAAFESAGAVYPGPVSR